MPNLEEPERFLEVVRSFLREAEREPATLVDLLRARAAEKGEDTLYTFLADGEAEEASLSYAGLDRRARAIGARLQEAGAAGERALLLYPPGLDFIAAFFGCLYAGAVAVPAYPPRAGRTQPRLRSIAGGRPAAPGAHHGGGGGQGGGAYGADPGAGRGGVDRHRGSG